MNEITKEVLKKISALEATNKKLLKENEDFKKATKRLEVKVLEAGREAERANHSAREANNKIMHISDTLRRIR
jgi:hypothetical protein